jgi:lysine-N-methylase
MRHRGFDRIGGKWVGDLKMMVRTLEKMERRRTWAEAHATLVLRTLPIIEHWDCHNCGDCCRGNIIRLDADDLARLKEQRWEEHPDYRGRRVIVSYGLIDKTYALAQQPDGACIFLTPEGRCRIHEVHGYDAKPRICKTFPLQIVPMENGAILTTRRSCPSAA